MLIPHLSSLISHQNYEVIFIIYGNTESLKQSVLNEIEALYDIQVQVDEFLPQELTDILADITERINREVALFINRKGKILSVSVGDSSTVSLPEVEGRRGSNRLSGVRCIHTHPNGDGRLSPVDIGSLLSLRLDAMAAIGVKDGSVANVYVGIMSEDSKEEAGKADVFGPFKPCSKRLNELLHVIVERDKILANTVYINQNQVEKAILVGIEPTAGTVINGKSEGERLLDELEELAVTAGVVVVDKVLQKRPGIDPAYFIGKGKIEQLNLLRQSLNANLIIFDDELSGAQFRNIEQIAGVKVIDRTTLILDIFAQRARSKEGKLQVELAQLKYRLPRLTGMGVQLSRLGGGIGTRGPGEKKLEVDKRHIRRRINFLENELENVKKRREIVREGRSRNSIPSIALVGYTNAGKSTLMNRLCRSEVLAEDKLFATLDPTARKLELPDGRDVLLVDTVGFIRKLPHDLIDAFKSTLEEAVYADALMHVADVSSEEAEIQISVVDELLKQLGAFNKPVILVLNKIDLLQGKNEILLKNDYGMVFEVSATAEQGIDELIRGIAALVPFSEIEVEVLAPYDTGWVYSYIHENGRVMEKDFTESGIRVKAVINKSKFERIREFVVY